MQFTYDLTKIRNHEHTGSIIIPIKMSSPVDEDWFTDLEMSVERYNSSTPVLQHKKLCSDVYIDIPACFEEEPSLYLMIPAEKVVNFAEQEDSLLAQEYLDAQKYLLSILSKDANTNLVDRDEQEQEESIQRQKTNNIASVLIDRLRRLNP
jgi:hypothetical protein